MSETRARTISSGDSESENFPDITDSIMNSSQISNISTDSTSQAKGNYNITHLNRSSCRFPKLEECAHFHYERCQLGKISVRLFEEKDGNPNNQDSISQTKSTLYNNGWFIVRVSAGRSEAFLIRRSIENLKMLDELLHQCVYDRKVSGLDDLRDLDENDSELEAIVTKYLNRFSLIASDALTCGQVLTWLQLDNKGRRLPVADIDTMKSINTPAVGAAYGVRRYIAQACDEISIEVGDMISVIDMPSPAESVWWRGKKSHLQKSQYEVGFFPQSCVATIGDKVPRHMPLPAPLVGSLDVSPTKPVLRKHGKLIAFFRSFILSRPSRRRLKQSGIYKERVFSCDLSEHLLNSGQSIPMVLKCCAEFIEEYGIVDGIYRLSGITSNIQKLRRAFDEERVPDLTHPEIKQDIHAVSSLLKMYFRELPNPLCTYQLYDHFVDAIQSRTEGEEHRLKLMRETVQKLPPPHYRTLKYLSNHLNKISRYSDNTGMTDRNLAIVWAPNLLRSPALESGGVAALRGVGVQAVVTEYLITHCELIFNSDFHPIDAQLDSLTDTDSYVEQREHDQSMERPKSLNVCGAKLLSIEEAQSRHIRSDNVDIKSIQLNSSVLQANYIEVGGGPSSLPDKYHTVLPVPRSWQKRKTHSWKSLFSRAPRPSNSNHDIKELNTNSNKLNESDKVTHQHHHHHHHHHQNGIDEKENTIPNSYSGSSNGQNKHMKNDVYDGKSITTMDVCIRSSSIDSLRTAGHSRSVSHDSYFDLLQSPLRGIGLDKEMSELGLNFDREEPEMRIFSESESLVSSPKIIKDQQQLQQQQQQPSTRRITRARPEEYSSTVNSVNPSPKKQPRLNIQNGNDLRNWLNNSNDESSCKRYKLEDQLSDIQFIDCSTPEHIMNNPNSTTIYTSVQIHNPPLNTSHEMLNYNYVIQQNDQNLGNKKNMSSRYSYPGNNRNSNKDISCVNKESRFSYPICNENVNETNKFFKNGTHDDDDGKHDNKKLFNQCNKSQQNNFSFYESNRSIPPRNDNSKTDIVLRSCSADVFNTNNSKNSVNRSKLSVATPQSPTNSPRYSLLVGETSSEASSSLNTPTYDNSNNYQNNTKELDKLKNNMSLDLNTSNTKKNFTSSTPNTPNYTHTSDNTSQSLTPSEFGYHNLNKIQSVESSPKSADLVTYENIEQHFYENSQMKHPIKATINITYVSPTKKNNPIICDNNIYEDMERTPVTEKVNERNILETTFDDKMVYEQVKILKSTITEVNELIIKNTNDSVVPDVNVSLNQSNDKEFNTNELLNSTTNDDVSMFGENDVNLDVQDVEFNQYGQSLYENVHVEQPCKTYENINLQTSSPSHSVVDTLRKEENNIIEETNEKIEMIERNCDDNIKTKPSNFIVRQLATKFETSPVENSPPCDFQKFNFNQNLNGNKKKLVNEISKNVKSNAKQLNKTSKITRSLDENAFVREFGAKKLENINQSVQQIQEYESKIFNENRRKSMELNARPKNLTPLKKITNIMNNDEIKNINNNNNKSSVNQIHSNLKLDLDKIDKTPLKSIKITPTTENRISLIQNNVVIQSQTEDDKTSVALSVKALENVKLDRERIEKIKEERRHQLNEKFRNESFRGSEKNLQNLKPKSKVDIRESKDLQKNDTQNLIDNNIMNQDTPIANYLTRIRRSSDEKNQNDDVIVVQQTSDENEIKNKIDKEKENAISQQENVKSSSYQRDKISPQRSIKDVAAMFESKLQNQ